MRCQFSVALIHMSLAHTCTPYSLARKTELNALPQPISSTRIPDLSSISSHSHSVSQRTFGPIHPFITHSGSYFAERGKRSFLSNSVILSLLILICSLLLSLNKKPRRYHTRGQLFFSDIWLTLDLIK